MNLSNLSVPNVRPSSAIRTDYKAFSEFCHSTMAPVIVTNNEERFCTFPVRKGSSICA